MTNFEASFTQILKEEGLYSNDTEDKGGETLFGISRQYWPEWEGWAYFDEHGCEPKTDNFAHLKDLACTFYRKEFWDELHLDDLPFTLARMLFSMAINTGTATVAKCMQETCNMLGMHIRGNDSDFVETDGIIGAKTMAQFVPMIEANLPLVHSWMQACWRAHYLNICANVPKQLKFFKGWMNRVDNY